jgi:hypothetical protein
MLIALVALNSWNNNITSAAMPHGILTLELAGDPLVADSMVKTWDKDEFGSAAFVVGLDFLFLAAWSCAIAFACVWASGLIDPSALAAAGLWLAWGAWLAGLLDVAENVALLFLMFVSHGAPWPQLTRTCAILKFVLVGAATAYVLLGAMLLAARKIARRMAAAAPAEAK